MQNDCIADQLGADAEDAGKFIAKRAHLFKSHASGHPIHLPAAPFPGIANAKEGAPGGLSQKFPGKFNLIAVHLQDHLPGHPFNQCAHFFSKLKLFFG